MNYVIKTDQTDSIRTDCIVLPVFQSRRLPANTRQVDAANSGLIRQLIKNKDISGNKGQTLLIPGISGQGYRRILLVGCGKEKDLDAKVYLRVVREALAAARRSGSADAALFLPQLEARNTDLRWRISQTAILADDLDYKYDGTKAPGNATALKKIILAVADKGDLKKARSGLRQGSAIAEGIRLSKDLGNLPGNICTPAYLAGRARRLQKNLPIKTTVLDRARMEKLGMGALLSVAKGSVEPPRLIIMEYQGGRRGAAPVVLVGKGLTFDAGGISLKPAAAMDEMKFDMCGGAAVFGTLLACAKMRLAVNLVGVVPSSENLPSGSANKPGDVVTSMAGKTIEILNTDAEGRLILCDALTYVERFKPAIVIDIATLTGACAIALGSPASGLFSQDDALAEELIEAGQQSQDRTWRLPLWDDYQSQLKSNFADMANVGGRYGGAITAACFLARFTKAYRWAHMDIAGSAWRSGKEKGATGRPVALLSQFLINRSSGKPS